MSSSYTFNKYDEPAFHVGLYGQARLAFVRKHYLFYLVQLIFTAFSCYYAIYSQQFYTFAVANTWFAYLSLALCLASQIVVLCLSGTNQTIKSLSLCVFTFFESYLVARICTLLCWEQTQSGLVLNEETTNIVIQAALMTVVLVATLTLYACFTKRDYTFSSALWSMFFTSLSLLILVIIFSRNSFLYTVYLYFTIVAFGFYLIIDTQMIIGGRNVELKSDQYITGAMLIYADVIVLFVKILILMAKKK